MPHCGYFLCIFLFSHKWKVRGCEIADMRYSDMILIEMLRKQHADILEQVDAIVKNLKEVRQWNLQIITQNLSGIDFAEEKGKINEIKQI